MAGKSRAKKSPNEELKTHTKEAQRKREVERLDALEAAAWAAHDRFQHDSNCDRFLVLVLDSIRRRCELLGLDTPYYTASAGAVGQGS